MNALLKSASCISPCFATYALRHIDACKQALYIYEISQRLVFGGISSWRLTVSIPLTRNSFRVDAVKSLYSPQMNFSSFASSSEGLVQSMPSRRLLYVKNVRHAAFFCHTK